MVKQSDNHHNNKEGGKRIGPTGRVFETPAIDHLHFEMRNMNKLIQYVIAQVDKLDAIDAIC